VNLNEQKNRKLAYAAMALSTLGFASVFFTVGIIGGFNIATLLSGAILALVVLGSVCGAVYVVYTLVTRGTALLKEKRPPLRGGEWWRR
jgi:hypothetical protein